MNVIARPQYSKGKANLSVTELLNSPRIVQLKRKHWDELEEDASSMVWSLFGTALHNILEHGKGDNHIVEERVFVDVDGINISGAIDLQEIEEDGTVISDYKTTSAWVVMNEKEDWHNQLNCYAYLLHKAKGVTVKKLQIVAIVRDWSAREAKAKESYPQAPIVVIDIPVWSYDKVEQYVKTRIGLHTEAIFDSDTESEMAECTTEEMWEKPTRYAVMKKGGVRAKSVHDTQDDAQHALNQAGRDYFMEIRQGERTRCANYCQVSQFCSQYQKYLGSN